MSSIARGDAHPGAGPATIGVVPSSPLPRRHRLRDGRCLDLGSLSHAERLYAAWLLERLRAGAAYHELVPAVAVPGAFPLAGKAGGDAGVRGILFQMATDVLARAGERDGLSASALAAARPGDYRSVTEAARALGISRAAVVQAIHDERLVAYRLG